MGSTYVVPSQYSLPAWRSVIGSTYTVLTLYSVFSTSVAVPGSTP